MYEHLCSFTVYTINTCKCEYLHECGLCPSVAIHQQWVTVMTADRRANQWLDLGLKSHQQQTTHIHEVRSASIMITRSIKTAWKCFIHPWESDCSESTIHPQIMQAAHAALTWRGFGSKLPPYCYLMKSHRRWHACDTRHATINSTLHCHSKRV